jgi:hypothetical protein
MHDFLSRIVLETTYSSTLDNSLGVWNCMHFHVFKKTFIFILY